MRTWALVLVFVWLIGGDGFAADWDGQLFRDESTLEFMTVSPDGEEYWSTVWLVVIDGDVYINLGKRAAERLRANTRAPFVSVRVAGSEFGGIRADPAQERQKDVAAAIAAKYWTGLLVPYAAPSLVMRLRPGT